MLRLPLVPTQTPANNLHSHPQMPLYNQRPNEMTGSSDIRTNTNGFVKSIPMHRESTATLGNHHPPGSSHILLQSRFSEPTLAASVALVQQTSSHKQPVFSVSDSSHETMSPHQLNGGGHVPDVSQLDISHSECRSKYDRLLEAHRKLQRTNGALEGNNIQCSKIKVLTIIYKIF